MKRAVAAFAALVVPAVAVAGPISKWDDRKPDFDYVSRANLHDVERCILDSDGWSMPMVYRQPDRPDAVQLIYIDGDGKSAGRIDMVMVDGSLRIKAWQGPKAITSCAPPE